jgi:2-dehydro-3-deoxyglucarate aldolase/4-hydroxy-2-oxoheptanedioate aldolase
MRLYDGTFKKRVRDKDLLIFADVVDSRSGAAVEALKEAGYDALFIDREHTALSEETIADHIRLARALDFPCMVRVAEDCYHELNRTLDQAPDGVFVPRIRSREQVERIVRTVKYPPLGIRGLAGSTCPVGKYLGWSSVVEQIEAVNSNLVVGIQIETAEALDDLDGILSVPGVDMAVVGNDDLSIAMGIPGQVDHPDYLKAVERVVAACRRHDVMPGIATPSGDTAKAVRWTAMGMRAVWYVDDICLIQDAGAAQLRALREGLRA